MTAVRESTAGTEVLLRQIDRHLVALRSGSRPASIGLPMAETVAASLRRLVVETAGASAVDRAKVRVAVHCFVLRREPGQTGPQPLLRVLNRILRELGRHDLVV